jgi:tripartite-type tricarboxylate transporter receptor subunit TctC
LNDAGIEPAPGTAETFTSFARAEIAKWGRVIKETGISAD